MSRFLTLDGRIMTETQVEHSERIEYTFGRWITPSDPSHEPWLWISSQRVSSFDEAVELSKRVGSPDMEFSIFQERICTVLSKIEQEEAEVD